MLRQLKKIWKQIRKVLLFIGKVQSIILLSVVYYLVLAPVAILFQLAKVVTKTKTGDSYWIAREVEEETEITLKRQF